MSEGVTTRRRGARGEASSDAPPTTQPDTAATGNPEFERAFARYLRRHQHADDDDINDPLFPNGQQPGFLDWASERVKGVALQAWEMVVASAPVQAVWRLWLVQYLWALVCITYNVFFQRLDMLHLHDIDATGGPARGLTAIVTGPTSGIGVETAAALARRGAKVILACRDIRRGAALKATIEEQTRKLEHLGHPFPEVEVWHLDLDSLKSVREFGTKWEQQQRKLNILINNAGLFAMGVARSETQDGFERHIGCNHLSHFLLTMMLLPALRRGAAEDPSFGSRIVHVTSQNHFMTPSGMRTSDPHYRLPKSYDTAQAYAQSKLAQILFCKEMRRRLGPESPIQVFAVHPGMILTNVVGTLPPLIQQAYKLVLKVLLLTPAEGSRASIWAATSPDAPLEGWKTMGYIDANCKPVPSSYAGQDMTQALWLWRWSAEQVQLPQSLDLPEA